MTLLLDLEGRLEAMAETPNPGFILVELAGEHPGQVRTLETAAKLVGAEEPGQPVDPAVHDPAEHPVAVGTGEIGRAHV